MIFISINNTSSNYDIQGAARNVVAITSNNCCQKPDDAKNYAQTTDYQRPNLKEFFEVKKIRFTLT